MQVGKTGSNFDSPEPFFHQYWLSPLLATDLLWAKQCIYLTQQIWFKKEKLILGWPKSSFRFYHAMAMKNPSELFGQSNIKRVC